MDRKFTELEKKTKATPAARPGARTIGVAKPVATGKGSTVTTPRAGSKAPALGSGTADRNRSKTPVSSKMQNTLNTSISSKTGGLGRDSIGPKAGGNSTTRGNSKSRNEEL